MTEHVAVGHGQKVMGAVINRKYDRVLLDMIDIILSRDIASEDPL